jgi:hypothetical protein
MVRIVGGIILMRIGFSLFMPQKSGGDIGLSGEATTPISPSYPSRCRSWSVRARLPRSSA